MDELVIEDKRYVSSKRAAIETGYAKDYVGQLCREGRIPARLVGRNWYVLESAIKDHRFGNPEESNSKPEEIEQEPILPPTWAESKYEASTIEELPTLNRLQPSKIVSSNVGVGSDTPVREIESIDSAWQNWFKKEEPTVLESSPILVEEVATPLEEGEVEVTVRSIYHPPLEPEPESVPIARRYAPQDQPVYEAVHPKKAVQTAVRIPIAFTLATAIISIFIVVAAALSTGLFDSSVVSVKGLEQIAGVSGFKK